MVTAAAIADVKVSGTELVDWLTSVPTAVAARRPTAQLIAKYRDGPPLRDAIAKPDSSPLEVSRSTITDLIALAGKHSPLPERDRSAAIRALAVIGRSADDEHIRALADQIRASGESTTEDLAIAFGLVAADGSEVLRLLTTDESDRLPLSGILRQLALAALGGAPFINRSARTNHRFRLLGAVDQETREVTESSQLVRYITWLALSRTVPNGKADFAGFLRRSDTNRIFDEIGRDETRILQLISTYDALGNDVDAFRTGLSALRSHLYAQRAQYTGRKIKFWTGSWQDVVLRRIIEVVGN